MLPGYRQPGVPQPRPRERCHCGPDFEGNGRLNPMLKTIPFTVEPLSEALGAEIVGLDLRQDLPPQTVGDIISAWHEHLVLLFRNQSLSEEDQIRFARHFGALQQRTRPPEARNEASLLKNPELTMLVSNIRENGKL